MSVLSKQIQEAVAFIRQQTPFQPDVAIILGTGLGALGKEVKVTAAIPYDQIPHFVTSTVETHHGQLLLGELGGKKVVVMSGRFHRYEGYTLQQITFPVRVMRALGAKTLLVSNAAGGMNRLFQAGDLMVIADHINLMGDNPLIGPNDDALGVRYPDMSQPYDRALVKLAKSIALEEKITLHQGVYAAMTGPCLETAAEYRMLQVIGADAIGMSTVPEVIVAVHAGFKVLAISVITDRCIPDTLEPADVATIIRIAGEAEPRLTKLMKLLIQRI